jgi:hypothetical protein
MRKRELCTPACGEKKRWSSLAYLFLKVYKEYLFKDRDPLE